MNLLAIGAHPDDIEFGCGGVVAREVQHGATAHFVVCSRGESGTHGTPAQREAEARDAAKRLGATIEWLDFGGDAQMVATPERALQVAAILRRVRPQVVLAPSVVENQHPDHVAVGRAAREACRLARYGGVSELRGAAAHRIDQLLQYAVTLEGEPREVTPLFFDVSGPATMAAWTGAMEAHASQLQTRNYVELQLTRARLNGLRAGVEHAIALFPSDPLVFTSLLQLGRSARTF